MLALAGCAEPLVAEAVEDAEEDVDDNAGVLADAAADSLVLFWLLVVEVEAESPLLTGSVIFTDIR